MPNKKIQLKASPADWIKLNTRVDELEHVDKDKKNTNGPYKSSGTFLKDHSLESWT
jgi:hypothetical protein